MLLVQRKVGREGERQGEKGRDHSEPRRVKVYSAPVLVIWISTFVKTPEIVTGMQLCFYKYIQKYIINLGSDIQ